MTQFVTIGTVPAGAVTSAPGTWLTVVYDPIGQQTYNIVLNNLLPNVSTFPTLAGNNIFTGSNTFQGAFTISGGTTTFTLSPVTLGTINNVTIGATTAAAVTATTLTDRASTNHGVALGGGTGATIHYTTPGTSGQLLTSNGVGADPTFQPLTLPNAGPGAGGPYNNFTTDAQGRISTASLLGYITGVTLTGDVTGTGTSTVATTLKNTGPGAGGPYNQITIDAQGRATAASSLNYARFDATNTWTATQNFNSQQVQNAYLFNYLEIPQSITASTGATSISLSGGNIIKVTISANTTISFTNAPSSSQVGSWTIYRIHDNSASTWTITWPASVKWGSAAAAPTLTQTANSVDEIVIRTIDGGTTYYASYKLSVNT
jgi:hypothetical protein